MDANLRQDLRFAVRSFLRAPRFTIPAIIALALGIGATSAVFSVVRGVLLEPLPYHDPDRIVTIWESNVARNRPRNVVGPANFAAWLERNRSFAHLGLVGPARFSVMLDGQPFEIVGMSASSEAFAALGIQPALGRTFSADEDLRGNEAVVVISHEFWQTRLGGQGDVLGQPLMANGQSRQIVGVLPPGFTIEGQKADIYAPYGWTVEALRAALGRGSSHGIARLRDGVSVAQAQDEMRTIAAQLEQEAPQRNAGWSVAVVPIDELTTEAVRPALLVLAGAVALVLLIACVNVANLLLARSTIRQRELGLRTALGAARGRLLRQMMTESLLLAGAGGIVGLFVAWAFHRGLLALVTDRIAVPKLDQVALDWPMVAFTMAAALGTGVVFGLVPALMASSAAGDALREGGRHGASPRARRLLGTLVVAEVALALVLLTGAGLLLRSFTRLQSIDPGFTAEGLFTARVSLPASRYPEDSDSVQFFQRLLARIEALPGVERASGITFPPLTGPGIGTSFYRLDRPVPADGEAPTTDVRPVMPGLFQTMGIPMRAGRDFRAADTRDAPAVAIISETLAATHLAGENPLGQRLYVSLGGPEGLQVDVVGVVGDVRYAALDTDTRPAIYLPQSQFTIGMLTVVARTGLPPLSLSNSVAAVVRDLDPQLPLADVRAMDEVVSATLARPRAVSALLTVFALIALMLAGVGIYGVMAYSVSQRTQEIGVRMALGATAQSVFRMVLSHALRLAAIGVGAGLIAAVLVMRTIETLLFQTETLDPLTFATTALVLVAVAALASYLPARRGTRIAPTEALRE